MAVSGAADGAGDHVGDGGLHLRAGHDHLLRLHSLGWGRNLFTPAVYTALVNQGPGAWCGMEPCSSLPELQSGALDSRAAVRTGLVTQEATAHLAQPCS